MRRFSALLAGPSICAALLALAGEAQANLSMGPLIHKLAQGGQNVKITLALEQQYLGDSLFTDGIGLVREDETQTVQLLEHALLHEDQAEQIEKLCHGTPNPTDEQCAEWPSVCNDCDDDGLDECFGGCKARYYFSVVDECVPPGRATYILSVYHNEEPENVQWREIDIEEAVGACLWDAEFGCLLSTPGALVGSGGGSLLLLGIGLLGLGLSRGPRRPE